jgi:hypothetical protein
MSPDLCADFATAYRSTFSFRCLDLDVHFLRRFSHGSLVPATFECATKTIVIRTAELDEEMIFGESIWSRFTLADLHIGVGVSHHGLPVGLASCIGRSQPSATVVVGSDEPMELNSRMEQGLHEIGRWPATFTERLPKKYSAAGLTASQKRRLFRHCEELPCESHTLFTLFWMDQSALQVRCADVMASRLRGRREDIVPDTSSASSRPGRFFTHWNEELWNEFSAGHLHRSFLTGFKTVAKRLNTSDQEGNLTGNLRLPETVTELSRLGKGFLPGPGGPSENPFDNGHVLSKVSCCDAGSLRWHTPSSLGTFFGHPVCPRFHGSTLLLRAPTRYATLKRATDQISLCIVRS